MRLIALIGVAALSASLSTHAQSPSFEVVSVKPTPPGTQGGGVQISPGGRVTWTNVTLHHGQRCLSTVQVGSACDRRRPGLVQPEKLALDPKFAGRAGLVTSLREQLGLKLEPARGPVDVLVIDHVERPTEN